MAAAVDDTAIAFMAPTRIRRMLKTKRIMEPREEADGTRILITRYWPRGVRREHFDEWQKELAPSASLLKEFKAGGISDGEFARRFEAEVQGSEVGRAALDGLRRAGSDITLLCHEAEGVVCHRHLLRRMIMGVDESPIYHD